MKFYYPIDPSFPISQTFEEHVANAMAYEWTHYNGGIDWACPTNTTIKAAKGGKVVATRTDAMGYGTHVRIQHQGGYLTIYAHLSSFKVQEGQEVRVGQIIGFSDNTGTSNGPHLHFELRLNGEAIDPAPFLASFGVEMAPSMDAEVTPATAGGEPSNFPPLPKAKVIVAALNIRKGPGAANPVAGSLSYGQIVDVIRTVKEGDNTWMHIGYNQYAAMRFAGSQLADWAQ